MWLKIMRRWLMYTTMTLLAPHDVQKLELAAAPPDPVANGERVQEQRHSGSGSSHTDAYGRGEPMLSDLLSDPVCQAMMSRDKVSRDTILRLVAQMPRRADRPDSA